MRQEAGPQTKIHKLPTKREILPLLENGSKKYEIRVKSLDRRGVNVRDIKIGDTIRFVDGSDNTVNRKVLNVTTHPSLENFLEEVDAADVMPGMEYEELLKKWKEIGGEKEKNLV